MVHLHDVQIHQLMSCCEEQTWKVPFSSTWLQHNSEWSRTSEPQKRFQHDKLVKSHIQVQTEPVKSLVTVPGVTKLNSKCRRRSDLEIQSITSAGYRKIHFHLQHHFLLSLRGSYVTFWIIAINTRAGEIWQLKPRNQPACDHFTV